MATGNADIDDLSRVIDSEMQNKGNGFPIEIFPYPIQQLINNAKNTKGFDKDYFSAGILSVCATAIGNSVNLYNGSYYSKPILWLTIIGSRGTGKTHPLNFAKNPLKEKDDLAYIEYQRLILDYEQIPNDAKDKKPTFGKFILMDFTPEMLAQSLKNNQKGVLVFQDELIGWINSFDKYKKGNDQQMYLELFNGNELTVDRVTKEPIRIPKTNVNIIGGMQPEIIKQFAGNNRGEDGFLDRFLFVYPENLDPHLFTGLDIPELDKENYNRFINNLLEAPFQTIMADTSNIEIFKRWQHHNAKKYFNDTLERSIQAKMETYVWRLALIIEMIQQAVTGNFKTTLQNENLEKAIRLVEYFRLNALRVHDKIMTKNPLDDLSALQLDLYKALPYEFKRAEILPLFEHINIGIRTGDRFLKNEKLFDNFNNCKELKVGHYRKKFKQ